MQTITIIAVGGLKERYLREACAEYEKRLGAYCKLAVVEVPEYKLSQSPSPSQIQRGMDAEGAAMMGKIPKGAYRVAMCIEGKQRSSEELAAQLSHTAQTHSHVAFLIGGSHGLAEQVKREVEELLSMSRMTFPHQLARVLLLEQVYRAYSILGSGRYHK